MLNFYSYGIFRLLSRRMELWDLPGHVGKVEALDETTATAIAIAIA